ncbi:MAG: WYL domain-containing protein [Ruminococcus sp.]|nr:WYL domain-containing protein [Ruminococcus sp.]
MAGVSRQKQKLLIMEQLFRSRTDETHAITGNQLIEILADMGIKAERKTIYDDIATLNDAGLNIQTTKIGHSNAYYMGDRLFDDDELAAVCDAVATSRFLTLKRSGELIRKLQTLTSEHKAPALRRSVHIENRTKSSGDATYKIIDAAEQAIFSDRQLELGLGESGADKKKQSRTERVSPFNVVWENDHFYIICLRGDENGGEVCRIRADRISTAVVVDEKRVSPTLDEELELRKLKAPLKNKGAAEDLRIRFKNELVDEVLDRFGDRTVIHPEDGDTFYIDAVVQLSPDFWGWLTRFGEDARIVSPDYVGDMTAEWLNKIVSMYSPED